VKNITDLQRWEVNDLIYSWFKLITDHAPVEDLLSKLDLQNLEMKFSEVNIINEADFRNWYTDVTHKYFNQIHDVKIFDTELLDKENATIRLVVNWQASQWNPPEAYSKRINKNVHQTWEVVRDSKSDSVLIRKYIVEKYDDVLTRVL